MTWLYHWLMLHYYGWRIKREIGRFRRFCRTKSVDDTKWTDEAIKEAWRHYHAINNYAGEKVTAG